MDMAKKNGLEGENEGGGWKEGNGEGRELKQKLKKAPFLKKKKSRVVTGQLWRGWRSSRELREVDLSW